MFFVFLTLNQQYVGGPLWYQHDRNHNRKEVCVLLASKECWTHPTKAGNIFPEERRLL